MILGFAWWDSLKESVGAAKEAVITFLAEKYNWVSDKTQAAWDWIVEQWEGLQGGLNSWGQTIVTELLTAIQGYFPDVSFVGWAYALEIVNKVFPVTDIVAMLNAFIYFYGICKGIKFARKMFRLG